MAKSPLMKKLLKNSNNPDTAMLSESTVFNEVTMTKTRIPMLNLALSGEFDGGLTSGFTIFAGPSKHFKSLLGLLCVAAYMKANPESICLYYDSEKGITKAYLRSMGIDPDRVVYTRIKTIEAMRSDITNQLDGLDRGDKVIVFVDSIGNTASKKEIKDALDDSDKGDMTRAKAVKSMFRIVTPYLADLDIPMVAICHTYDTQEMYSKKVVSGGTGLIYSADTIIIMGKQQVKEGTELAGYDFIMNIEKSRFVKEKSKFPLHVTYTGGVSMFSGLMELAQELKFVQTPTKGWRSRAFLDKETGEFTMEEKKWRESDTETVAFWRELFKHEPFIEAVRYKFKLSDLELNDDAILEDLYSEEVSATVADHEMSEYHDDIPDDFEESEEE